MFKTVLRDMFSSYHNVSEVKFLRMTACRFTALQAASLHTDCNIYIFIILKGEVTTRNQHFYYILNLTMALIILRLRFGFNKILRLSISWLPIIEMGY